MDAKSKLKSVLWSLTLILVACSTGHCRRDGKEVLKNIDAKPPTGYEQQDLGSIKVSKSDGSLQCGMRAGMSLEDMAQKELPGVKILSSEKLNDGLMRIQSCGAETGMLNVYQIRHQDLRKAQKAGFTLFNTKTYTVTRWIDFKYHHIYFLTNIQQLARMNIALRPTNFRDVNKAFNPLPNFNLTRKNRHGLIPIKPNPAIQVGILL